MKQAYYSYRCSDGSLVGLFIDVEKHKTTEERDAAAFMMQAQRLLQFGEQPLEAPKYRGLVT